jgi:hypothetical protein
LANQPPGKARRRLDDGDDTGNVTGDGDLDAIPMKIKKVASKPDVPVAFAQRKHGNCTSGARPIAPVHRGSDVAQLRGLLERASYDAHFRAECIAELGIDAMVGSCQLTDAPGPSVGSLPTAGTVRAAYQGVLPRGDVRNLQVIGAPWVDVDNDDGVYKQWTFDLSCGLHKCSARSLPQDAQVIAGAGENAIVSGKVWWDPAKAGLFIRDVKVVNADLGYVYGQPTTVSVLPHVRPAQPNGAAVLKTLPGIRADAGSGKQPIPPYSCRGYCICAPVTDHGSPSEDAAAASVARGGCVLDVFPVPDYNDPGVADAPRNPNHALEDDKTPRVQRYAV